MRSGMLASLLELLPTASTISIGVLGSRLILGRVDGGSQPFVDGCLCVALGDPVPIQRCCVPQRPERFLRLCPIPLIRRVS